jgi:glyoxylase-like metal-dependent hydrolase (beta-lactamase superfamily II)
VVRRIAPANVERLLAATTLRDPQRPTVTAFLLGRDDRVALVDVGAGASMGADCGHLLGNLRAAGIVPEQVDMVILTHIHPEHSNGLVGAAGAAVFPRAELVIPREDFKFWVETDPDTAAERFRRNMMAARRAIAPYRERIRLIDDEEAMPGVAALPLPGQTPGQTRWMVESEGGESCGSGTGKCSAPVWVMMRG